MADEILTELETQAAAGEAVRLTIQTAAGFIHGNVVSAAAYRTAQPITSGADADTAEEFLHLRDAKVFVGLESNSVNYWRLPRSQILGYEIS